MFKIFQKKCSVCGMDTNNKSISRYGEKFCSESCLAEYKKQNQIAGHQHDGSKKGSCCH